MSRIGTILPGVPLYTDLLEEDLDARLAGFTTGASIYWGLAFQAATGSWAEPNHFRGIDWEILLFPPKGLKLPRPHRIGVRASFHAVAENSALLLIKTGKTTLNDARDIGRGHVRALFALLR